MMRRRVLAALVLLLLGVPATAGERWGWLGVRIRDLSEQEMEQLTIKHGLREGFGVMIAEILKDTPAAGSRLRAGDIIVSIEGRPVVETRALQRIVGGTEAGHPLEIIVLREGRRQEVQVKVGEMPPDMVAERIAAEFGFFVREPSTEGVSGTTARMPVVGAVADGSAAARGGLVVDDRILAGNGVAVASVEAFRRQVREIRLRDSMRLSVQRRGEPLSLTLPAPQAPLPAH
jgi:serine protease Do